MYLVVRDNWGSYVDARDSAERELVEAFALEKHFCIEQTEEIPIIDYVNGAIKNYEEEMKKVSMKKVEASKADKAADKAHGYKEGSKKDVAQDKKLQAKMSKKK